MRNGNSKYKYKFGSNKKLDILVLVVIIVCAVIYFINNSSTDSGELTAPSASGGECEIHMIDVGQGDAFLIKTDAGNLLIDAGSGEAEDDLYEYLKGQGIADFEYVVFSHPHEDHIGNGDMVIDNFNVKNVIMGDVTANTVCFENLLYSIDNAGCQMMTAKMGDTYSIGELTFKILGPRYFDEDDLNNCSIVMRVEYGEISMLFSGDAEKPVEYDVLEDYPGELDCDIYKVAHHGSSTSNGEEFIDAVSPNLMLISCGFGNSYGHPHREIIEMFDEMDVTVKRTDSDGDVVVATDGEKYWLKEN